VDRALQQVVQQLEVMAFRLSDAPRTVFYGNQGVGKQTPRTLMTPWAEEWREYSGILNSPTD